MKLTEEHLKQKFDDTLQQLANSSLLYDQGNYAEAIRLAGSITKLIGDRLKSDGTVNLNFTSISTRLNIKPSKMVDLSLPNLIDQEHLHGPLCIMGLHVSNAKGLAPILDWFPRDELGQFREMEFNQWWNYPVVRDADGNEFSRKKIIETVRDKEDAHVDQDLDATYANLAYNGSLRISHISNKKILELDQNPARVVVRQIAQELLRTFIPAFPPIFISTYGNSVDPIMLVEIREKDVDGNSVLIKDHKFARFAQETTNSSEVWNAWSQFLPVTENSKVKTSSQLDIPQVKDSGISGQLKSDMEMRLVFYNFAPYPITGVQAMVGYGKHTD